jgi:hypothetical protein
MIVMNNFKGMDMITEKYIVRNVKRNEKRTNPNQKKNPLIRLRLLGRDGRGNDGTKTDCCRVYLATMYIL